MYSLLDLLFAHLQKPIQKCPLENIPITIIPLAFVQTTSNTIVYEQDQELHHKMFEIFSTGTSTEKASSKLHSLLCCLPLVEAPKLGYDNLFRIIIMQFIDAYNFDVRAIKKSCVHIVNKDYKIIPFETMNLFYRDEKATVLEILRQEA